MSSLVSVIMPTVIYCCASISDSSLTLVVLDNVGTPDLQELTTLRLAIYGSRIARSMFDWLTAPMREQHGVESVLVKRLPIACSQARPNFRIEDTATQPRSGTTSTLDSAILASGDTLSDALICSAQPYEASCQAASSPLQLLLEDVDTPHGADSMLSIGGGAV